MEELAKGTGCQDDGDDPEKLARLLIEEKGFSAADLELQLTIDTEFNNEVVTSKITLVASVCGKRTFLLRYAPGSVVTRERSAVAAARILDKDYQIPLVVVTNGVDAVMLDTYKGKVLAQSLEDIPSKAALESGFSQLRFEPFADAKKREREMRILNAFDVDL